MKTRSRNRLGLAVAGLTAVCLALALAACKNPVDSGGGDTPVTFSSVIADGSSSQTSTQLTLTFSVAVSGLSAADITLSGVPGVTKGSLSGSGSTYTLPISGFTSSGTLSVAVEKAGYDISGSPKPTAIYYYSSAGGDTQVTFSGVSANGSSSQTTTQLTLTFSAAISGLSASDITLSGVNSVSKGTLSGSGPTYTMPISGFTAGGQMTVAVAKSGYTISGGPKQVQVYYYDPSATPVSFTGLTADGSATATTAKLTLTFDKDITNLAAGDVTLTAGNTGATKGALTKAAGTGVYELALSGISTGGQVTVAVSKSGYTISPPNRNVTVNYYTSGSSDTPVSFTGLTADGSATATTTKLTLTFDKDITSFATGDITLSAGSTGAAKGALTKAAGTGIYELALSGISAGGQVTVAVAKSGYAVTGSPKQVTVYYYADPSATPVSFSDLTADGSATATTTKLTLTFDKDITNFAAGDITLTAESTGATKGALTKAAGTGVYELALSGISEGGQVAIAVAKSGYTITPATRNVTVYYYADPSDTPVTFTDLTADGSATATTTKLTLTFDKDITGLSAGDITFTAGSTGATKDALNTTSTIGVYELALSGISAGGEVTVAVAKNGYAIEPASKTVTVNYVVPVSFSNLTADGSATETTTKLTLTFDKDIPDLAAGDITLSAGSTGATKGALTSNGNGLYELALSGISAGGEVTVAVAKTGYAIEPASKTVMVNYVVPVSFNNLAADGSATATTTKITLTFDKDITDLAADDITLTAGSTGATKGTLTRTETGVYELAVSGITAGGEVTVEVSKSGYTISPSSKNVNVFIKTQSNVGIGVGNPSVKLYLDGGANALTEGGNTPITGTGTFTVSIAAGTYSDIVWYVNGSEVSRGATKTSYTLPKRAGTYLVTVEATPTGGEKDTGSHRFVVQ